MNEEIRRDAEGGDQAGPAGRVCPACGRMRTTPYAGTCEHCGARTDVIEPGGSVPGSAAGSASGATGSDRSPAAGRDRDLAGRARNARPRDGLGRPLAHGAEGIPRQPEGVRRSPEETLAEAQSLLDSGKPFHAHEVLEDAWKTGPEAERGLWRGLAQFAVGLTHAARGNTLGATTLLRRAVDGIVTYRDDPPYGIDVAGLSDWAEQVADDLEARPDTVFAPLEAPRLRGTA